MLNWECWPLCPLEQLHLLLSLHCVLPRLKVTLIIPTTGLNFVSVLFMCCDNSILTYMHMLCRFCYFGLHLETLNRCIVNTNRLAGVQAADLPSSVKRELKTLAHDLAGALVFDYGNIL